MPLSSNLPFLVSGCSTGDMGQIPEILGNIVFSRRWEPTKIRFTPKQFAGLIILGDSCYRATSKHYERERVWLDAALEARVPVLGICYGAQLLATRLNKGRRAGGMIRLPTLHRGVCAVELCKAGETDPVMAAFKKSKVIAMYHEDSFQEPQGATALARSVCDDFEEHCEAYRVGEPADAVYGVQFHPEPTQLSLQYDDWFPTPEKEKDVKAAVETGRKLLQAWAELAVAKHERGE